MFNKNVLIGEDYPNGGDLKNFFFNLKKNQNMHEFADRPEQCTLFYRHFQSKKTTFMV